MIHLVVFEHFDRMCDQHSRFDRMPLESSVNNQHTDTNIEKLLTMQVSPQ